MVMFLVDLCEIKDEEHCLHIIGGIEILLIVIIWLFWKRTDAKLLIPDETSPIDPLKCACSPLHVIWRPDAMESDNNYYYYDPTDEVTIVNVYWELFNS